MKNNFFWLVVVLFITSAGSIFAQNFESKDIPAFDFYTRAPYRESVPRPSAVLRYDVGDFHTTYAQMEKYLDAAAKSAPDRVRVFDIGETNEHRMQHVVAISAPENIARLDEIKANNNRLTDPRKISSGEAQNIIQNNPAFAWMAYTIHGNESASFEAMLQVIYQFAASNEPQTLDILKNTVVLIVASENPDGHERFATWYNSVATGNADRNALEHREPWSVYGRLNHFRFDLNRDNIAATQIETKNLQKAFFDWNPQLAVDHHGQPAQFHFPPAALPINPNLPQPQTNKWLEMFGRANAAQFDRRQWDFFVRDVFDLFYPGYWDSFPSLSGATGMTYETDGGGFKGLRWTRDDGTIVTFRSAIAKHYVASLTTLETLAENRQARLQDFYDFKRTGVEEGARDAMRYIIIPNDSQPNKIREIAEILRRAKIETRRAAANFQASRVHSYNDRDTLIQTRDFPPGSLIVDLSQPNKRLAKALLEPETPQDAEFVKIQADKFRRNQLRGKSQSKEDYGFYDITAWSLPTAFGIEAFYTSDAPNAANAVAVTDENLQAKDSQIPPFRRAQVAYIVPYEQDEAAVFALRMLAEGYKVSVAARTLNALGTDFPRGTFVVRVTRNPASVHDAAARLAAELNIKIYAADTGFQDAGDTGIGNESVVSLSAPRIAMVADEAVEQTSYGSIWWTLDRYKLDFTPLTISSIKGGALKNYTVLIMPNGAAGRYFSSMGSGGVSALKEWISGGGTLVTVKGASVFAALKDVNFTSSKLVGSDNDEEKGKAEEDENPDKRKETEEKSAPKNKKKPAVESAQTQELKFDKADGAPPVLPPIASPSASRGQVPEGVPGAIMRATVDRTSYLTYGLENENLPVLISSGYFFRLSKEGTNALVFEPNPQKPFKISGFVWEGNTERLLKGTAYLIDEPTGAGHVVMFAEEPFFRGIFRSMTRPFFNSLLFNGTF